ncbi:MAG: 6-bladed beta-propeller [Candidatus Sabulitectum sp.]|nr:6-bladed beta-propeller [Candidatus Sabulitectum sp.]
MKIFSFCGVCCILFFALISACTSGSKSSDEILDVLDEWRMWLEASSPPEQRIDLPLYIPADTVLSPDSCGLEYYMIECFVIDEDNIYLSDGCSQNLLAFTKEGDLLWKIGGDGEGPGLFTGIGEIAIKGDTIAVCNHGVGRIDFFNSTSGDWLSSISVLWPYDLCFLPDGNLVVLSLLEHDMVSIFSPEGEKLSGFGNWQAPGQDILNSMFRTANRNLRLTLVNDSILAVNAYYFNWGQVYNLNSGEMMTSFRRNLPYEERPIEVGNGAIYGKIYTNDIASYQEYIAVLNRPIESNWDLPERYDDIPYHEIDFSMIDLYQLSGIYVGSIAIPRTVGRILWYEDDLYCATDETGELIQYAVIGRNL